MMQVLPLFKVKGKRPTRSLLTEPLRWLVSSSVLLSFSLIFFIVNLVVGLVFDLITFILPIVVCFNFGKYFLIQAESFFFNRFGHDE